MHKPFSNHPYFKHNPIPNLKPRRDKISLCFGEEIKPSQRGKYQVNNNRAVKLTNDKVELLRFLEKNGIPVPTPIHSMDEFVEDGSLNMPKFDSFMEFPVQVRGRNRTVMLESYADLVRFLPEATKEDYAVHGFPENFERGSITIAPGIGSFKRKTVESLEGMIHMEGVHHALEVDARKVTVQVAKLIGFDIGTVEMIQVSGTILVENVSLAPTDKMMWVLEDVIDRVVKSR